MTAIGFENDRESPHLSAISLAGRILLSLFLGYALISLGLLFERNIAGAILLFYLAFLTIFVVFFRNAFSFVAAVLCLIPALNVFFDLAVIKFILLTLPLVAVIYYRKIMEGLRRIGGARRVIFYAGLMMLAGLLISLANAFIRGALDREMITQVCLLVYQLVVLALVVATVDSGDKFVKVVNLLLVPAVALIALVILYFFFSNITAVYHSVKGKNFEIGDKLIHANLVAMIIMPVMIAAFPVVMRKKIGLSSLLYGLVFPLSLIALILTSSRGAWVGFLCGMGYFFFRLKKMQYVAAIIVIVLIVGAVFGGYVVRRYTQTHKFDGAILERYVLWQAAVKYIASNPLAGLGPNYFRIEKYKLGVPANVGPANAYSTHNIILEMAVNYGVFALVGFVLFVSYLLVVNDRLFNTGGGTGGYYHLSVNAAIISTMIHSMFDCNIANVGYMTVLMFLLGLSLVLTRKSFII